MGFTKALIRRVQAAALVLSVGCGMPRDPEGTLQRVSGGTIRAGITENEPWTRLENGRPSGAEVRLLERFAQQLDAEVAWVQGSESELLNALHQRRLDVVIGGFTDANPWSKKVALTQPYITVRGEKHVVAAAPGENRWILELDRYLQDRELEIGGLVQGEEQP